MKLSSTLAASLAFLLALPVVAQTDQRPQAPASQPQRQAEGWDEIDVRVVFLTTQLAGVESSIQAIDKSLRTAGYKMAARQGDADRYNLGNENMDRNGGGPVPWDQFYGNTARKFYYHSTTAVVTASGDVVVASDQKPLQRPPQFDYIYRANAEDQKRAERDAAALGSKIEDLLRRRHHLESEQSALWAKIALRIVSGRRVDAKPLYQFALADKGIDAEKLEVGKAACDFVRSTNALIGQMEDGVDADQSQAYRQFSSTTKTLCGDMVSRLLHQPHLALDLDDAETPIGKLILVTRRLEDISKNIDNAWRAAQESDKANDWQRAGMSRAMLQDALVNYAETFLNTDERVRALAKEWAIAPDPAKPIIVADRAPFIVIVPQVDPATPEKTPSPTLPMTPPETPPASPTLMHPARLPATPQAQPNAQDSGIDLLKEFDAGHWTQVVKQHGSVQKTAKGYHVIADAAGGTVGWSYPLGAHTESYVFDMRFRMASRGTIKMHMEDEPDIIKGVGVALSFDKLFKGFHVGNLSYRETTQPLDSLAGGWHTLHVVGDHSKLVATLDRGEPVQWTGRQGWPISISSLNISGVDFSDWYIDSMTLRTAP